jgi:hypothetical protein
MDQQTLGVSMRSGVVGAVLVGLLAHFLMWIDFLMSLESVLPMLGALVAAGTLVVGLVLIPQKRTRRFGFGLLLGFVGTSIVSAVAFLVVVLYILSVVSS